MVSSVSHLQRYSQHASSQGQILTSYGRRWGHSSEVWDHIPENHRLSIKIYLSLWNNTHWVLSTFERKLASVRFESPSLSESVAYIFREGDPKEWLGLHESRPRWREQERFGWNAWRFRTLLVERGVCDGAYTQYLSGFYTAIQLMSNSFDKLTIRTQSFASAQICVLHTSFASICRKGRNFCVYNLQPWHVSFV